MSGRWASSSRRSELPSDWAHRRQVVKRRAGGQCQAEKHEPRCTGVGTECDHVGDKHDHSLANLRWLSAPCHQAITQAQARAGRAKLTQRRPTEPHPGLA